MVLFTDVTETVAALNALQTNEAILSNIYRKLPVGIELYDRDGVLIDLNEKELEIFGVSCREEVLGINFFDNPNVPDELKEHVRRREEVDFSLRATIPALGSAVLNTAGVDAQRKGFGVDALNRDNFSWVLSRMALEVDARPRQYAEYEITTWVNEYGRVLSTRNFTLCDAGGREFGRAVTQWLSLIHI